MLMRLRHLRCLEVDVSEWDPAPTHFAALRALTFELLLYCPSVSTVVFVYEFERHLVKILLNVFGLDKVADTKVGDAYIRGISGGQKKRVSLAEVLATRCLVGSWDGATKGLECVHCRLVLRWMLTSLPARQQLWSSYRLFVLLRMPLG